jgi:hypothetical protein
LRGSDEIGKAAAPFGNPPMYQQNPFKNCQFPRSIDQRLNGLFTAMLMEHRCERGIETGEIFGILPKRFSVSLLQWRKTPLLLYRRLWRIVTGEDINSAFQEIPAATKQAIIEILFERKSYVPIYHQL